MKFLKSNRLLPKLILPALFLFTFACTEQDINKNDANSNIPADIIKKLTTAGFGTTEGLSQTNGGYLVEGDIFLTPEQIDELAAEASSTGPVEEHYRTNNLVTGTRDIRIFFDPNFDAFMDNAFNTALARFNNLNLRLNFVAAATAANSDIQINLANMGAGIWGQSAGFPTGGNPATPITLNSAEYGAGMAQNNAATVIAHEIGHAIGFRHTDFMNRGFSCNQNSNEGDAGVGANHIPGTPTNPEWGSWMLACIGDGVNRPFTDDDEVALIDTYGLDIIGDRFVCSTTGSYMLNFVPPGSTVSWAVTPANLVNQATGNGTVATFRAANGLSRGAVQLTYTVVTARGQTMTRTRNLWVGAPRVSTNPTGVPMVQASIGSMVTLRAIAESNSASSYNWWVGNPSSGVNLYNSNNSIAVIECLSSGTYHIYVTGTNECGTSSSWHVPIRVTSGSSGGGGPEWPK